MAEIDGCPVCEGQQRTTWMFTHLAPPATLQSCEEHTEINLITLLATRLNVAGEWLYGVIEGAVNGAADEHEAEQAAEAAPGQQTAEQVDDLPEAAEEAESVPVQG